MYTYTHTVYTNSVLELCASKNLYIQNNIGNWLFTFSETIVIAINIRTEKETINFPSSNTPIYTLVTINWNIFAIWHKPYYTYRYKQTIVFISYVCRLVAKIALQNLHNIWKIVYCVGVYAKNKDVSPFACIENMVEVATLVFFNAGLSSKDQI